MLNLQELLRRLEPFIVRTAVPEGRKTCPRDPELLENQRELWEDRLYLGDTGALPLLRQVRTEPGGAVLIAGATRHTALAGLPSDWTQIYVSCSLARLFNTVAQAIRESGERGPDQEEPLNAQARVVQLFWDALMERRLIHRSEVRDALMKLPCPVHSFLRAVVVTFKDESVNVPYNYLLERLQGFFPDTNMTVYQKDIVILFSHSDREFRLALDKDWKLCLTSLLKRYDGVMTVGNGTRHAEALASMYLLSKRTGDLAYLLRKNRDERIFTTEDYIVYSIIDLCVQRYLEAEQNEDVLYLTHPAVPALTRYDREHNANLRDVLFYYLFNNCNVNKTAAVLYMHRNTVNNKIKQIKRLTGLELEEPELRQRLLLSCQIMRYYEIVMQKEMQ